MLSFLFSIGRSGGLPALGRGGVMTLIFGLLVAAATAAERKPNVVLILIDDFGFECVTANGGQSYQTPTLDRLAATGMRFENCHVQPLCTPTRVELMTGLSNARNYLYFGILEPKATTFAHLLKKAGYATGICGKWQLGQGADLPQHFGFDESYLWQHTRRPPRYANPGLEHNGKALDFEAGEYGPTLLNAFAMDFVTRHRDEPFFLYYPMVLTHDPFQPTPDSPDWDPKAKGEQVNRDVKHFADMTAYMDKMVAQFIGKLEALGLRENTLVLILGDNGTGVSVRSQFKGEPYPGGKGTRTARGTHVPMIANWPGKIAAGSVNTDLISAQDYLPTLCDFAGVPVPSTLKLDGRSFYPQLRGERGQPREWLYSWYARNGGPTPQWDYAMSASYKLYRDGQFFDLQADPFEQKPQKVASLTGPAAAAAKTLQGALDRFANVRPPEVSAAAANAGPDSDDGDGAPKKKAGKGKKKQ